MTSITDPLKRLADEILWQARLARFQLAMKTFNPLQPRDDDGRWSGDSISGGGDGAGDGGASSVRHEHVQKYVSEMRQLHDAVDNQGFDSLIEKLRDDKEIRQQEMREIHRELTGLDFAPSKPRKEILQNIINWQALDARQRARIGSHSS